MHDHLYSWFSDGKKKKKAKVQKQYASYPKKKVSKKDEQIDVDRLVS